MNKELNEAFERFMALSDDERKELLKLEIYVQKKSFSRAIENEAEEIQRIERVKEMREDDLWREYEKQV